MEYVGRQIYTFYSQFHRNTLASIIHTHTHPHTLFFFFWKSWKGKKIASKLGRQPNSPFFKLPKRFVQKPAGGRATGPTEGCRDLRLSNERQLLGATGLQPRAAQPAAADTCKHFPIARERGGSPAKALPRAAPAIPALPRGLGVTHVALEEKGGR